MFLLADNNNNGFFFLIFRRYVIGVGSGSDCEAVPPTFSEIVEEDVIYFFGEGSGADCDMGNPEKMEGPQLQETTKSSTVDTKPTTQSTERKPKLWSIEAICNSDKTVDDSNRDEIPKRSSKYFHRLNFSASN